MLKISKIFVLIGSAAFIAIAGCALAQEGGVAISPHIIDERGEAGEIFEHSVVLRNGSDRKVTLYAVVNNLLAKEGRQDFTVDADTDRSISLAHWIEVTRGAQELGPGESKEIPLKIDVSPHAKAGEYYAAVTFAAGSNRYEAERRMKKSSQPQVMINLVVAEHVVESAQISSFATERKVFFEYPASFSIQVDNSGNRSISPSGGIFLYNRQGEEVGHIPVGSGSDSIGAGKRKKFHAAWEGSGVFGRFKAKVQMDYGRAGTRDLKDTLYFWVLPWPWVAVFAAGVLILMSGLFWLLFRKARHVHQASHAPVRTEQPAGKEGVINLREE